MEERLSSWPGGVNGATDSTMLGADSSPRGLNTALDLSFGGKPLFAKRKGLSCINSTPITGSPDIIGQFHYYRIASNTHYHMLVSDTGRLDTRSVSNDAITNRSTALTAGTLYPDFTVASDLCFIVNGTDRLKFDGTSVTQFGITRPTVGTMAGAAGSAGVHSGTYELRVTFGNTSTGHESSASDTATATVTVTNQQIDWSNVPTSSDTQVNIRYLYARNTATQTQFYRVGSIADNATTTASTNTSDDNAITPAPGTTARNRPPSGAKFVAHHQGRVFVATESGLYWSDIDDPEAFNALSFDGINASDGQRITGLVSANEILIIFKEDRLYGIFNGNDPLTWQVRLIDDDFGCASHRSIVNADGMTYWWSRHGLCAWGGGEVVNYTDQLYGPIEETLNFAQWATVSAAKDETNNRLLIAVPAAGSTRANYILPFHTGIRKWEATYWDPMDAASLGASRTTASIPAVYLGGHSGQLFLTWSGHQDGVVTGTQTGTWVATGTNVSAITGLLDADGDAAACDTTGGGLIERMFQLVDSTGTPVATRRRITANTATGVTLVSAIAGLVPGATYTWHVGGPACELDTPWVGDFAIKKRYEHCYPLAKGLGYGSAMTLHFSFDWQDIGGTKDRVLTTTSAGSEWDEALWDVDVWDTPAAIRDRLRMARVGFVWRCRITNVAPNAPLGLLAIGVTSTNQTRKR